MSVLRRSSGCVRLFAGVLLCCSLSLAAFNSAAQVLNAGETDLWWTPNEWGWGMQVFEQGTILFVTLFIYDSSGQHTVFTSVLSQLSPQVWTGDLAHSTSGPYFATVPYNSDLVKQRLVGTMKFTKASSGTGTLEYSIDGVTVTKNMARQLFRYDDYTGKYMATVHVVTSHCSNSADNGDRTGLFPVAIEHSGGVMTLKAGFARNGATSCTYSGDFTQGGRVGALGSSFTCSDGDEGAMGFFELSKRPGMFAGRFQGHSITDSCDYTGAMTGLLPN